MQQFLSNSKQRLYYSLIIVWHIVTQSKRFHCRKLPAVICPCHAPAAFILSIMFCRDVGILSALNADPTMRAPASGV